MKIMLLKEKKSFQVMIYRHFHLMNPLTEHVRSLVGLAIPLVRLEKPLTKHAKRLVDHVIPLIPLM